MSLLAVAASDTAPEPLRVHGHILGETVTAYAANEGTSLDQCRDLLVRKTPRKEKQTARLCRTLLSAAEGQETFIGPAYATGWRSSFNSYPFNGEVMWSVFFAGGRLVHVTMTAQESTHVTVESTLQDLIERYGPPTTNGARQHQNLMGATFTTINAVWDRSNGTIFLWEDFFEGDLTIRTLRVDFVTHERAEYLKKQGNDAHHNIFQ